MAEKLKNVAASVKDRLLNLARQQGRGFDVLLVRFALERLLFRLSQSPHRENYVLKGGMLVTQWLDHDNRETRAVHRSGAAARRGQASARLAPALRRGAGAAIHGGAAFLHGGRNDSRHAVLSLGAVGAQ